MARREYKGAATPTRLLTNIDAVQTTASINSNSGWPTGGANGPFVVILDPDVQGKEEHILVGAQSGGNLTSITRGYGDTSATTHSAGADGSVIHGVSKVDYDEANRHINDATIDEHTQYMKADGTRHDLNARHLYGGALGTRPVPVAIGTALSAGSGAQAAAGDHVHIIGTGAINLNAMFANSVIGAGKLGAGAISASSMFAADVVDSAALANASIDALALFGGSPSIRPYIISATNPGAVGPGIFWVNTSKDALLCRNAADTNWNVVSSWGAGINYTPTLTNINIGTGNARNYARYYRFGRMIIANGFVRLGTSGASVTGRMGVGLPVNAVNLAASFADEFFMHGGARATGPTNSWAAVGVIGMGTVTQDLTKLDFIATAGIVGWSPTDPFTWGAESRFSYFVEYETADAVDANYV